MLGLLREAAYYSCLPLNNKESTLNFGQWALTVVKMGSRQEGQSERLKDNILSSSLWHSRRAAREVTWTCTLCHSAAEWSPSAVGTGRPRTKNAAQACVLKESVELTSWTAVCCAANNQYRLLETRLGAWLRGMAWGEDGRPIIGCSCY